MTSSLWKNVLKDISKTKARFVSIMLIVALGVGFFTGVKSTSPSMNKTAELYYSENNLMDISLLSTVGFSDKDVDEIKKLDHVRAVMPSYYSDMIIADDGTGSVIRLYSNPEGTDGGAAVNIPIVKEGRLPQNKGEIALENAHFNSGNYQIGDVMTIEPQVGGEDVSDTLESLKFTVVGFVQSPLYVSYTRGTTTVGNGTVHMFGLISPEEFKSDRYTRIYVLTDYSNGDMKLHTISDEFNDSIEAMKDSFLDLGKERAKHFDSEYLTQAREKLDDAQQEFDKEKAKAEKELKDGKKKLDNGIKEYDKKIGDAEKKLEDAKKQIEDGEKQIKQGWIDYENGIAQGQKKLDESEKQLSEGQKTLNESRKEYDQQILEAQKKLNEGEREYEKGLEEYNAGLSQFKTQTMPAKAAIALLKTKYETALNKFENITKPACNKLISSSEESNRIIDEENKELQAKADAAERTYQKGIYLGQIRVNNGIKKANQAVIEREQKNIEKGQQEADSAKQEYEDALNEFKEQTAEPQRKLDDAKEQLDSTRTQLDEGKQALAAQKLLAEAGFTEAQQKITDGQTQLAEGKKELSEQKTEGKQKLKDSEEEIEKAKTEYEEGKKKLEEEKVKGQKKLDKAKADYEKGKKEAEEKLLDAQVKIDKAKEKLDDLEDPKWYFFTRLDNPGYQSLVDDTTRIDSVAAVFPLFFLMVAALVCLTTLKRYVEEKRTEIGTLKALGYSDFSIQLQYIFYASTAAFAGCAIGICFGVFTLPFIIYNAYGIMYELLPLKLVVPVDIMSFGIITAFVCTTVVAIYSCRQSLKSKPAELMRPKAPKIGKRILLERVSFIWSRMNFTSKVTVRNIARYKARFIMTVAGIAGCTALMLTGFGLKDANSSVFSKQFGEIYTYDMIAILEEEGTAHQNKDVLSFLEGQALVSNVLLERQTSIEVENTEGKKAGSVYLFVPQSKDDMKELIHLRERKSKTPVELTNEGVVITEKMADTLSVKPGDDIIVIDDHKRYKVKVTGISENYVNAYVFFTPEYYNEIYGKTPLFNMVMCKMTEVSDENESKLGSNCLDNSAIAAVSFISGSITSFEDAISSLDTVTLVLIICAGLLAVVVLYNLTDINIAERQREIATIKVLGFYNGETCSFVYRENIVLTLCGIAAGLGLGVVLLRFVILSIEVNNIMFGREIFARSYMLSILLTAVFSAAVNFIMYFKIKKIDMVESLKSVE